jgi:hypothetical protein
MSPDAVARRAADTPMIGRSGIKETFVWEREGGRVPVRYG